MRSKNEELPPRVYRHGLSFRYCPIDGPKVNLGRDYQSAMARYALLTSGSKHEFDPCEPRHISEIFKRHRKGAKQRGLEFSISEMDIAELLEQQGRRCAVTFLPFNDLKPNGMRVRPWLPSLDRIHSNLGYAKGNIRVVCGFVNVAMNGFGNEFFAAVLAPLIDAQVQARLRMLRGDIPMGTVFIPTDPVL